MGRDIVTGEKLSTTERVLGAVPLLGKVKGEAKVAEEVAEETTTLRHYTSNKGLDGIKKDLEIKAYDKNTVFAEKAKGKPLSAADASDKYGISKSSARNYVEFKVPSKQVSVIKNPDTKSIEYVITGNVKLDKTAKFIKRN